MLENIVSLWNRISKNSRGPRIMRIYQKSARWFFHALIMTTVKSVRVAVKGYPKELKRYLEYEQSAFQVAKKGYLKGLEQGIRIWEIRVAVGCPNIGNLITV